MLIRKAKYGDTKQLLNLLSQVLELHAEIRPDIFIPGTTKYTESELKSIIDNENSPIFVAVNDHDIISGYAFCQLRQQPFSNNMIPFKSLFIDDLCIDSSARGQHIGKQLFDYIKAEAKKLGCYEVTLNVWNGNDKAIGFYKAMGMKIKEMQLEYILN